MKQKRGAYWWLIILLAVIKFTIPFLLQSSLYELQRDEYLYFQQGLHPALGYLENPPLISWMASISSWMGGSVFAIKFWPALIGAGTVIVTCLLTAEFGGKLFAQALAGLSVITGAFLRVHALFQPNMLDIFFWTVSIYFLIRFIRSKQNNHLLLLSICLALSFWSKYSILFLMAALFVALLSSRHRYLLFRKKNFTALALFILLILPNIYWQYAHNWPILNHMEELRETQLRFLSPKDFLLDQVFMNLPSALVWIAGFVWLIKLKELRYLAIAYLFVIILLVASNGKSYYSLGIYPVLFAAGGVAWQQGTARLTWLQPLILVLVLLMSYIVLPMMLPIYQPAKLEAVYINHDIKHTWEDLKEHALPQDFADMLGWKELTEKTENFYTRLPDSVKQQTVILCRNYGQAGSMKFYGKSKEFKNKVISSNGSFLFWIPKKLPVKNLVLVAHNLPDSTETLFQHFKKTTVVDSVTNTYSRQFGDKVIYFEGADDKVDAIVQEALAKMNKKFNRW